MQSNDTFLRSMAQPYAGPFSWRVQDFRCRPLYGGQHQKSWTALVIALILPSEGSPAAGTLELFLQARRLDFGTSFRGDTGIKPHTGLEQAQFRSTFKRIVRATLPTLQVGRYPKSWRTSPGFLVPSCRPLRMRVTLHNENTICSSATSLIGYSIRLAHNPHTESSCIPCSLPISNVQCCAFFSSERWKQSRLRVKGSHPA